MKGSRANSGMDADSHNRTQDEGRSGAPGRPDILQRNEFLAAMRRVAASVSVVTTDGDAGRHGATVSTFCSVSADPPTVLVCLRAESRIAAAVQRNGRFTISVLPENQASTAHRFAGAFDAVGEGRFAGISVVGLPGLAPGIDGATVFGCRLGSTMREASHLICMGLVDAILAGPSAPLAYLGGAYCRVIPDVRDAS